jgi:ABC-type transporter Mla subunit MlaD
MTRVLDANSSTLLSALSAKSHEFTGEVQRATQTAVSAIESKGFDFTRTMLDNSNELARVINDAGETATARVNQTMQNLQYTTREAIEQSQRIATESVNQVMETHARLRGESTTLFERMREANVLLHEVLTGAHENMAVIEESLTSRVSEFASTMNDVTARSGAVGDQLNAHAESFRTETAAVLENLSEITVQFAQHGRTLVQAVEVVEKSNERTEQTVSERRDALETLVATLDLKSEDLEQRLQRFTALLDQSLNGAEARARDIGRMIAESSSVGTRTIAEQFELVRETTEQERKRTSDVMRAIYEQSVGETDSLFRQSSERFAETLANMRHMAAEMQAQLEQTRTELRRGILELPQETAENAAQMRRVIVDQIEALAELNRIVSKHGRSIETAEPRRSAEPMLAVVGGGRTEARPQARHPEHPQTPAGRPVAPPPPPAPRGEAYPQGAPAGRNQGGWLSDLLQRADEGQAPAGPQHGRQLPPPPPRPLDSLDALSADIARLVEHDAAIDMWDRYNRGERNAFTRQLYTMNGQRAFDDIRNRYRADRNFRTTVDRYIAEFERLLEDVSRDERGGQAMVRTYLISETGKVYTMLAHAAGRFD